MRSGYGAGLLLLLSSTLVAEIVLGKGEEYTFQAAQRYCQGLGDAWRTLRIEELFDLRGSQKFSSDQAYWSANSVIESGAGSSTGMEGENGLGPDVTLGYSCYIKEGDVTISPLSKRLNVLCTDSPYQPKAYAYETQGDLVVDRFNGIVWHDLNAWDKQQKFTFEQAREQCESLELDDRSWRLPYVDELYSIVRYDGSRPAVDRNLFGLMYSRYYWSDDELNDESAYVVGFKLGSVATSKKTNASYVRCVSDLK